MFNRITTALHHAFDPTGAAPVEPATSGPHDTSASASGHHGDHSVAARQQPGWVQSASNATPPAFRISAPHPKKNNNGQEITIRAVTTPTPVNTWTDPQAIATFSTVGDRPTEWDHVRLTSWHPPTDWKGVDGQNPSIDLAAPFQPVDHLGTSAGVVIIGKDARILTVEPTNHFGGYVHTFPKGDCGDLSLQEAAIKHAYEKTGLKVELIDLVGDYEGDATRTRYYLARIESGNPHDMGWQTQAVSMVPPEQMTRWLARTGPSMIQNRDQAILLDLAPTIASLKRDAAPDVPDCLRPRKLELVPVELVARSASGVGTFRDQDGNRWYVKKPRTTDMARNEVLAAKLYALAGVKVPDTELGQIDGSACVASRVIEGGEKIPYEVTNPAQSARNVAALSGVHAGFVADCWLANWDNTGMTFDNILAVDGEGYRIDFGGALQYRALGQSKGDAFGDRVDEINTLRDKNINPASADVFKNITGEALLSGANRIANIPAGHIEQVVRAYGPPGEAENTRLLQKILNRRINVAKISVAS